MAYVGPQRTLIALVHASGSISCARMTATTAGSRFCHEDIELLHIHARESSNLHGDDADRGLQKVATIPLVLIQQGKETDTIGFGSTSI